MVRQHAIRTVVLGTAFLTLLGRVPDSVSLTDTDILFPEKCVAAQKAGYLSQTYIDTVIQRAYENFTTAIEEAATEMTQEAAIRQAKLTVERLKRLAENDVNRKYILWKVSELEYQIFLEERELVHKSRAQSIGRLNELAEAFNREVGLERPDFVRLKSLQEEFAALSAEKGREIETLITRRSAAVGRQVSTQISAALAKGDIETARRGLDYCYANRGLLAVAEKQIEQFAAALQTRLKLTDQRRFLEEDMRLAQKAIVCGDLRTAWSALGLIDRRLGDIGAELPSQQLRAYQARRQRLAMELNAKEDSLVDVNIAVYNTKGRAAAREYMEGVLRAAGVSREKLAVVDQAMVDAAAAAQQKDVNPELRKVFVDLSDAVADDGTDLLSELSRAAKIRAQEKADSAMAAQAETEMAQQAAWRKTLRKERRAKERAERRAQTRKKKEHEETARQQLARQNAADRSRTMAEERRKAEQALAERPQTDADATGAGNSDERNRALAQQNTVLIYNLLEQGHTDAARERFLLLREPLRHHLAPEAYATLESCVMQPYRQSRGTD